VALLVCQVSEADCPAWIELGFTAMEAVGAGGGGGGGGGGGAAFFLHAPRARIAQNATSRNNHFRLRTFTFIPPYDPYGDQTKSFAIYYGFTT
jgi:hypothetical protein